MKTLLRSILVLTAACRGKFRAAVGIRRRRRRRLPQQRYRQRSRGVGSATAGFQTGAAFGGYVGYSQSKHIGGEIRYGYLQSNLKLTSGGSKPPSPACPTSSTTT